MLSLLGRAFRHCDGLSRRTFLKAGALGMGGLGVSGLGAGGFTLADLLRAEEAAGIGSSTRAVINLHLDGGPPQMDMIDPKPDGPAELRGELSPIASCLPGVQMSELLPKLAAVADRLVLVRSLVGSAGRHDAFQCQSGYDAKDLAAFGGRPALGCVVAKLKGSSRDTAPSFVDMMQGRPLVRNSSRPGFLGPSFKPFRPDMSAMFQRELEPGMVNELAAKGMNHTTSLSLNGALDARRLDDRANLLSQLDGFRREIDGSGMMDAVDRFTAQAASILTSGRFADALDLAKEDPRVVERYTLDPAGVPGRHTTSDLPNATLKLLLARRLIEAGVRCVSVSISDFDTHSANYPRLRQILPIVDHALSTLIVDLEERGMLDDVTIVAWGEFGRTPKINKNGGRDHWPKVGPALLAGGGMRSGQVIGSTDRTASVATSRPVHYQEIFATLFHNLGIDAGRTTIVDPSGRPRYLIEQARPLAELV